MRLYDPIFVMLENFVGSLTAPGNAWLWADGTTMKWADDTFGQLD